MEWDNLTYVELADVYYGGVAFEADMTIDNQDVIEAQRVKVKIAKLLYACLSGERTQPMIRLIGKYVRLDNKILKFILMELRSEFVSLIPQED